MLLRGEEQCKELHVFSVVFHCDSKSIPLVKLYEQIYEYVCIYGN